MPGFVPGISGVLDVDAADRDEDVGLHESVHEGMTCLTFSLRVLIAYIRPGRNTFEHAWRR